MCEERRADLRIPEVGTPDFRARRSASQLLGFQLFARWLRTGEISTREERTWIGELGEAGARHGVSIASMTRGYLVFRDATLELINEEAARLGTPLDVLESIRQMNYLSCDSSILWMNRNFDHQKELQ